MLSARGKVILAGDFNARHGQLSVKKAHERGFAKLLQLLCQLSIASNIDEHTHHHNSESQRTVIDYIICSSEITQQMKNDSNRRKQPTGTVFMSVFGHRLIWAQFDKLLPPMHQSIVTRYKSQLLDDESTKEDFQEAICNQLGDLNVQIAQSRRNRQRAISPDNAAAKIKGAIVNAARSILGVKQANGRKGHSWWSTKLAKQRAKMIEVLKHVSRSARSNVSLVPRSIQLLECDDKFKQKRSEFRKSIREAKRNYWCGVMEDINKDPNINRVFGLARALCHKRHEIQVAPEKLQSFWSNIWAARPLPAQERYIQEIEELLSRPESVTLLDEDDEQLLRPFTAFEVKKAAKLFGRHKAADFDGIDNEMLAALPDEAFSALAATFNELWSASAYPEAWRDGRLVF